VSDEQLGALRDVQEALDGAGIDCWLFGGWAVDFYAGEITRVHDDIDFAVWLDDHGRIVDLLAAAGWKHAPYGSGSVGERSIGEQHGRAERSSCAAHPSR
jgi:hypothetical protein